LLPRIPSPSIAGNVLVNLLLEDIVMNNTTIKLMNFAGRIAAKRRLALSDSLIRLRLKLVIAVLSAIVAPTASPAATSTSASTTLANGLRIVAVHFPGSTNVSIFTFLPLGLASLLPMLNQQLAESLTTIPDLASFKDQLPPQVSPAMAEGNIAQICLCYR
jgi:hypothetical protein